MKLGISYNLFEGEELLEASIRCIREHVDFVSVVYQTVSHFGDPCSENLLNVLDRLIEIGYIDLIEKYEPNIVQDCSPQEGHFQNIEKRNRGLDLSKRFNCTHHMPIDVDEFYISEQFSYMKKTLENENYDNGACQHSQYYKDEIYMTWPKEQEYVSTISKIKKDTRFIYNFPCRLPIDPSRKTNNPDYLIFSRAKVEMHHLSFVRKNLKRKLLCSFARQDIEHNIDKIVKYYEDWQYPKPAMWAGSDLRQVKQVERQFNIWN